MQKIYDIPENLGRLIRMDDFVSTPLPYRGSTGGGSSEKSF